MLTLTKRFYLKDFWGVFVCLSVLFKFFKWQYESCQFLRYFIFQKISMFYGMHYKIMHKETVIGCTPDAEQDVISISNASVFPF